MKNSFVEDVQGFVWERINNECYSAYSKNDEYIRLAKEEECLIEIIQKCASLELKIMLEKLGEIQINMESIKEPTIYKHGMKDGLRFINTLSVIREDEA